MFDISAIAGTVSALKGATDIASKPCVTRSGPSSFCRRLHFDSDQANNACIMTRMAIQRHASKHGGF